MLSKRIARLGIFFGLISLVAACGMSKGTQKSQTTGGSDASPLSIVQELGKKLYVGEDMHGRACSVDLREFGSNGSIRLNNALGFNRNLSIPGRIDETDCSIQKFVTRENSIFISGAQASSEGEVKEFSALEIRFHDRDFTEPRALVATIAHGRSDRLACVKLRARMTLHLADFRCRKLTEIR